MTCRMLVELRQKREAEARYDQLKIAMTAYAIKSLEDGDKSGFVKGLLDTAKGGKPGQHHTPGISMFDVAPVNITKSIIHTGE